MAGRRILPLILVILLGTGVLLARLYQIQIVEARTWTSQAATLVRSGAVRPYQRGAILDAHGRPLAHDERVYRVLFNYRDFRRGHPLGIVAHARTALLGTPVSLSEAFASLPEWSGELVALSSRDLEAFASGKAMRLGSREIPATDESEREARRARRSDVRFYVAQLLELDRKQSGEFGKASLEREDVPLIEIAAEVRGNVTAEALRERLRARLVECGDDLAQLARQLDADELERGGTPGAGHPLERLLARLELWRAEVEDDAATDLFEEVWGFAPGRVEPELLHAHLDLEWIEALLGWDSERSLRWLHGARERWRENLLGQGADRLVAALQVATPGRDAAELVLERWVQAFAAEPERTLLEGWRRSNRVAVLDELDELLDESLEGPRPLLLPWQDLGALGAAEPLSASWETLARVELGLDAGTDEVGVLAARWSEALGDRVDARFVRERTRALLARLDHDLQLALERELGARLLRVRERGRERIAPAEGRLDRASERARYVLKDRGSRALVAVRHPSYSTVLLVSRHADRFAGLRVEEATERVVRRDERGVPVARGIVGSVGQLDLREHLVEGERWREFIELRAQSERSAEEERELRFLARRIVRGDELRGRSGLEGYFNQELTGRNGYREVRGLQNRLDGVYLVDVPPEDGLGLELTLDLDLQQAAVECLAAPEGPPQANSRDAEWLERPTGAIVLLELDGDVLAAASFPDFVRDEGPSPSPLDLPLERTLRKAPFQPPGSSFKPFVAAWALARLDLDPVAPQPCVPLPSGRGAGYVDVRCASTAGHGVVGLRYAIQHSCNSYFARLGERFSPDDWRALASEFGFGSPTGIRPLAGRSGWVEHSVPELFRRDLTQRESRLAGNGLSVVEATPMQVARATAALATGVLPDLRIVRRVGGVEQRQGSRPLGLPGSALSFVRDAMYAVANETGGSGQPALHSGELGFRMAAKTGSGDIDSAVTIAADGRPRVRKHTWLVGWFPYEAPRYAVVVFCEDTLQTASNSAIWLARQYLRRPEVQALVRGEEAR